MDIIKMQLRDFRDWSLLHGVGVVWHKGRWVQCVTVQVVFIREAPKRIMSHMYTHTHTYNAHTQLEKNLMI